MLQVQGRGVAQVAVGARHYARGHEALRVEEVAVGAANVCFEVMIVAPAVADLLPRLGHRDRRPRRFGFRTASGQEGEPNQAAHHKGPWQSLQGRSRL